MQLLLEKFVLSWAFLTYALQFGRLFYYFNSKLFKCTNGLMRYQLHLRDSMVRLGLISRQKNDVRPTLS